MSGIKIDLPQTVEVGKEAEIVVHIPKEAGTGPLNVSVKAQLTPKPLEVKDNGNQTMSVTFTPRANGKHEFSLSWGDAPINGSPFAIEVSGTAVRDARKVKVTGFPSNATAGQAFKFTVSASDEAGPGPLTVDAEGIGGEPKIDLRNTSGGNFEVEVVCPSAGEYKLDLSWGDNNPIPGSPFNIKVSS